jgi:formamidopyrimidine-DNA glycosylase
MPELPDVETFRRYFGATAMKKKITDVQVLREEILEGVGAERYRRRARNRTPVSSHRHGKHLFIGLDDGSWLTFHFGMTGFFKYYQDDPGESEHPRVVFSLDNGYRLAYDCSRLLGRVGVCDAPDDFIAEKDLGPDALSPDLDAESFVDLMVGRRGMIKSALMNQSVLAGVGNVYSDEILLQCRMHPKEKVTDLSENDLHRVHGAMREVLTTAVDRQADPERMPGDFILPAREEGASCPVCGGGLQKIAVSGRNGLYCPRCQKLKN